MVPKEQSRSQCFSPSNQVPILFRAHQIPGVPLIKVCHFPRQNHSPTQTLQLSISYPSDRLWQYAEVPDVPRVVLLLPQLGRFTKCRYFLNLGTIVPVLNPTLTNRTRTIFSDAKPNLRAINIFFPPFLFSPSGRCRRLLQCCIVPQMLHNICRISISRDSASMLYMSTCILLLSSWEPSLQISSRIILSYHGRRCILVPLFFPFLILFTCFGGVFRCTV